METTTFDNFRNNLKSLLDRVFKDHSPLYVAREHGEDVVVMSKADYEAMQETNYLLKSPANATRLMEGLEEYERGGGKERKLFEE